MPKLRKKSYPERPPFPRPKKPMKGKGRPSSSNSNKKSKTFQSTTDAEGKTIKVHAPWYRSPHRKLWH
jgi:hypothetical protein